MIRFLKHFSAFEFKRLVSGPIFLPDNENYQTRIFLECIFIGCRSLVLNFPRLIQIVKTKIAPLIVYKPLCNKTSLLWRTQKLL